MYKIKMTFNYFHTTNYLNKERTKYCNKDRIKYCNKKTKCIKNFAHINIITQESRRYLHTLGLA